MPPELKLGAVRAADGEVRAALLPDGGEPIDLNALSGGRLPSNPAELLALEDWDERVAAVELDGSARLEGRLVAPQPRPSKVIAVGLNYVAHSAESGEETPERPLLFAKWPNSIIGPDEPIRIPAGRTTSADYEVELAAVIGRHASRVGVEQALRYVGGYTVANDVSARDVQFRDGQWTLGKSFDTFCPLGPAIVPAAAIPDVQALRIATEVNGELRQQANTAEMVFPVAALIAYVSDYVSLVPGDVILTGTPAGVGLGFDPPRWLADGDVVVCSIEEIGSLKNPVEVLEEE